MVDRSVSKTDVLRDVRVRVPPLVHYEYFPIRTLFLIYSSVMSSTTTQEGAFTPYDDVKTFYEGIRVEPLTRYANELEAAIILGVQMCKLNEEVGEVTEADDQGHKAEEAIDVAYVSMGITYLLDRVVEIPVDGNSTSDEPTDSDLSRIYQQAVKAHESNNDALLGDSLSTLALASFALVNFLGYNPEDLWEKKHRVNVAKYDKSLYAILRSDGMNHIEAIGALKASWPERRLQFDDGALPIDSTNGHLIK